MNKLNVSEAPKVPFDLDGKILFSSEQYELVHLTLQSGESIPMHSNPFDVLFFVIEGSCLLQAETQSIQLHSNDSIHIVHSVNRGITNNSASLLRLLVYKYFR